MFQSKPALKANVTAEHHAASLYGAFLYNYRQQAQDDSPK